MKYILMLTMMIIMLLTLSSCKLSMHIDDEIDDWDKVESWIMNTDGTYKTLVPCGYEAYLSPDNQKLKVYAHYDGIYEYDLSGSKTKLVETPNLWFYSISPNRNNTVAEITKERKIYLTDDNGVLLTSLTNFADRQYTSFRFIQGSDWIVGYSSISQNNDYKAHIIRTSDFVEFTISDTVEITSLSFDNNDTVFYGRKETSTCFLIKKDFTTSEMDTVYSSSYRIFPIYLINNNETIVFLMNSKLYTINTVSKDIRLIYSFTSEFGYLYKYMYIHPNQNTLFFMEKDLKKLDLITGECTVLATGNIEFASLSPDGSKIYYITKTHIEKDE